MHTLLLCFAPLLPQKPVTELKTQDTQPTDADRLFKRLCSIPRREDLARVFNKYKRHNYLPQHIQNKLKRVLTARGFPVKYWIPKKYQEQRMYTHENFVETDFECDSLYCYKCNPIIRPKRRAKVDIHPDVRALTEQQLLAIIEHHTTPLIQCQKEIVGKLLPECVTDIVGGYL
jgi:hypothetical protein